MIDAQRLERLAADRGIPTPIWVPQTTSTQDAVRTWAEARRPEGSALVADEQTEGRGRLGRSWQGQTVSNTATVLVGATERGQRAGTRPCGRGLLRDRLHP